MSIKINHTTDSIICTNSSYIYFPNGVLNADMFLGGTIYGTKLNGELSPLGVNYALDSGQISPTCINWFNTLTPATTLTAGVSTPTSFTANKRFVMVVAIGGGGGGEGSVLGNTYNALGGNAGSTASVVYDLWNITTGGTAKYTATIGAGGSGGTTSSPIGGTGGDTVFNIYDPAGTTLVYTLTAVGGYPSASYGDGQFTQPQALVAHNTMYRDGLLGTGTNGTTAFAGYGGQASMLGVGASGGNATTPSAGTSGAANTGAGGGGGGVTSTTRTNGGSGGSGVIKIYYF